jgi:hypothetical protein
VEAVAVTLDDVLDQGAMVLYDHYLHNREGPYAANRLLGSLQRLVELVYMAGDGEHSDATGQRGGCMCSSEIPVMCSGRRRGSWRPSAMCRAGYGVRLTLAPVYLRRVACLQESGSTAAVRVEHQG